MLMAPQKNDKIWILREGLERAESFLLSKLPMDVQNVGEFCRFIQRRYNEHYGGMTDKDSIIMKNQKSGTEINSFARLSRFAGNTEEGAYIFSVAKGKSYQARPMNVKENKKKWPIKKWPLSKPNRKAFLLSKYWPPNQHEDLPSYSRSIQTPIWNHNAYVPDQSTSKAAEAYGAKWVKQIWNDAWDSDLTIFLWY